MITRMMMTSGIPSRPNMVTPWTCRGNRTHSITSALAGVLLLTAPSSAQFTSSTTVVEVYATVTDATGRPVKGLTQADFEVVEDGAAQTVTNFAAGEFPLRVALTLDRSFSVAGRPLEASKRAALGFLAALRSTDESVVLGIGSEVTTLADASVPRAQQSAAVQALDAWGTTKLHDAIIQAIDETDAARGRRAVVILSDGDDRYSEASAGAVLTRARRANVLIYPVALSKNRPALFAELSSVTGGRSFHVPDLKTLDATLVKIASELREQYLLGYSPSRPFVAGRDEWRSITVRVKKPNLTVRARDGYYVK
jgi:Ca-activated chloride channel homolog